MLCFCISLCLYLKLAVIVIIIIVIVELFHCYGYVALGVQSQSAHTASWLVDYLAIGWSVGQTCEFWSNSEGIELLFGTAATVSWGYIVLELVCPHLHIRVLAP